MPFEWKPAPFGNGRICPFSDLRTIETRPRSPTLKIKVKGNYLWVLNHIILGTVDNQADHYHLNGGIQPLNPNLNNGMALPGSFYLIDDMDLMEYEKSAQPYTPDPEHFEWVTINNFSNIGVITLLLLKKQ